MRQSIKDYEIVGGAFASARAEGVVHRRINQTVALGEQKLSEDREFGWFDHSRTGLRLILREERD